LELRYTIELPYLQAGLRKRKVGILLCGPPGCGKTLIAREMLRAIGGCLFSVINGPELLSRHVGEAERQLREAFHECKNQSQMNDNRPAFLFFDEVDAVLGDRDKCDSQYQISFVD
jgi:transitional endoplasmic reticulum ATPase